MYAETYAPNTPAGDQTAQQSARQSATQPAPHGDSHAAPPIAPQPAPRLDPHPGHATGPRTADGKARSSRNALKHGLTSQEAVLQEEAAEDFEALRQGFIADRRPVGETEETLVEIMALATWRLRRVWRMEPGVFAAVRAKVNKDVKAGGVWMLDCMDGGALDKLGRHEARFHRQLLQSEARLRLLQKLRLAGLERPHRASTGRRASGSTGSANGKFAERTRPMEWVPIGSTAVEPQIAQIGADERPATDLTDKTDHSPGLGHGGNSPVQSVAAVSLSHATGGSHESGDFAKRTPAALSEADAQAMLDALRVEPLPPHPLHGAPVRDELTLFVRGADGQLRELARRVLSGG